jgi:hypothetical protein
MVDEGEPHVPGWPMTLTGMTVNGIAVGPLMMHTGDDGCAIFSNLLPGNYTVTEGSGGGTWRPTGATSSETVIESTLSGSILGGTHHNVGFTNVCTKSADFGTKGYWHNKNGLAEIMPEDIAMVNALLPYSTASTYFEDGDEPFDGLFMDGSVVAEVVGAGAVIAPAGNALAEISHFLADSNASGDHREQLAQQLLAFLFNSIHRLGGGDTMVLINGSFVSAQSLIDEAIEAWMSTAGVRQTTIKDVLDMLNNSDAVEYIPGSPCAIAE